MFARYKVNWYFDGESLTNKGYVQAYSYAEAVQKIEAAYDSIEAIDIRWVSDSNNCLDDDDIADANFDEEEQAGAGSQVFTAIEEATEVK